MLVSARYQHESTIGILPFAFLNPVLGAEGLPWWLMIKNSPVSEEDSILILGSGRSLGEGNENPLQDSYLDNPMDREARQASVRGVAKGSHPT